MATRPETTMRRKTSPRTCTDRANRRASPSATVDLPAAGMPVTRKTDPSRSDTFAIRVTLLPARTLATLPELAQSAHDRSGHYSAVPLELRGQRRDDRRGRRDVARVARLVQPADHAGAVDDRDAGE